VNRKVTLRIFCLVSVLSVQAFSQPDFSTLKGVHFEIKYQGGIGEQDARAVSKYLENDLEYLKSTLGLELARTIEVKMFSVDGQFLSSSGQTRPWKAAVFRRNTIAIQPLKELQQRDQLEKSLAYELSLAILASAEKGGCPQWLRESFAAYHSGVAADVDVPVGMRMTTFADVNQDIQKYGHSPRRNDIMWVLAQTMQYLIETFSEEKSMWVFIKFDGTKSVETIFKDHFGRELKEVETEWSSRLNERMLRGTTRE